MWVPRARAARRARGKPHHAACPSADSFRVSERLGGPADDREEWIGAFARELDAEPPTRGIWTILNLAGAALTARSASAAPVACWIGGQTGRSPESLREIAKRINPSASE